MKFSELMKVTESANTAIYHVLLTVEQELKELLGNHIEVRVHSCYNNDAVEDQYYPLSAYTPKAVSGFPVFIAALRNTETDDYLELPHVAYLKGVFNITATNSHGQVFSRDTCENDLGKLEELYKLYMADPGFVRQLMDMCRADECKRETEEWREQAFLRDLDDSRGISVHYGEIAGFLKPQTKQ